MVGRACGSELTLAGDAVAAGSAAAALSGAPSTLHALATGGNPLEATLAAGQIVLPAQRRRLPLLAAALPLHLAISLGWASALAVVLPRRRTTAWGALAGLGIAAIDLGVAARRFPRVAALPLGPQLADHLVFGAVVGAVLSRRRGRTKRASSPG